LNANVVYYRGAPKVEVLRGFWGNENLYKTAALPLDATQVTPIYSGQVMFISAAGGWILATATNAKGLLPYIAMEDSTDSDVTSSGKLLGLSFSNNVEIQTPYADWTQVYTAHSTVLTFSAIAGLLTSTTATGGNGFIQTPAQDVLGHCTAGVVDFNVGGPGNLFGTMAANTIANAGINSECLPIGATSYAYASQTLANNNTQVGKIPMLQFSTLWLPARDVTNPVS